MTTRRHFAAWAAAIAGTHAWPASSQSLPKPARLVLGFSAGGATTPATAGLTGASTATTGGLANPIVSAIEDGLAIGGILLGWFMPFLTAALVFVATIIGIVCIRRLIGYVAAHRERRVSA